MEAVLATVSLTFYYTGLLDAIPPPQCFANFRWEDCGRPPEPVMYYWKLGSRCEVGMWKGCLPNVNMFKDEYECVSTCIFSVRALPRDFHNLQANEETTLDYETTETETETETTPKVETTIIEAGGDNGGDNGGDKGGGDDGGGDNGGLEDGSGSGNGSAVNGTDG